MACGAAGSPEHGDVLSVIADSLRTVGAHWLLVFVGVPCLVFCCFQQAFKFNQGSRVVDRTVTAQSEAITLAYGGSRVGCSAVRGADC